MTRALARRYVDWIVYALMRGHDLFDSFYQGGQDIHLKCGTDAVPDLQAWLQDQSERLHTTILQLLADPEVLAFVHSDPCEYVDFRLVRTPLRQVLPIAPLTNWHTPAEDNFYELLRSCAQWLWRDEIGRARPDAPSWWPAMVCAYVVTPRGWYEARE